MIDIMMVGFAHELNNLLTVMQGSLQRLHRQALDGRGQKQLVHAEWAAQHAAQLTQQILSFAQPERRQDQVVDMNSLVARFSEMAKQMVPEGVVLVLDLTSQPLAVKLDPGQLELALLNLLRNAIHAIPASGQISIRTSDNWADEPNHQHHQQRIVEVSVSDTGIGMSRDIAQSATTPFVTTKAPGEGVGLGLWMVQCFMSTAGGKLEIEAAGGQGTTIRLLFPCLNEN